jgi:(p)ppGpp synthase/HD superfamily hydrolase
VTITFDGALRLAARAHEGQVDLAGEPYVLHVLRVALRVLELGGTLDDAVVGLLHDSVEDCDWVTPELLLHEGLTASQVDAVDRMTKRPGESYQDRVTRVLGHPSSRLAKRADLEDNMDVRRMRGRRTGGLTERDRERLSDYLVAWTRLVPS